MKHISSHIATIDAAIVALRNAHVIRVRKSEAEFITRRLSETRDFLMSIEPKESEVVTLANWKRQLAK